MTGGALSAFLTAGQLDWGVALQHAPRLATMALQGMDRNSRGGAE